MRLLTASALALTLIFSSLAPTAMAQDFDEIVVTARKREESYNPGITLTKQGDYLLLEANVENDARDAAERRRDMLKTLDLIIKAAASDPTIELSIIDENNFVRPLTVGSFDAGIKRGSRPDTSLATLIVKTQIPEQVADSYSLLTKLTDFVDAIDATGRTQVASYDEVTVSIVNPEQYRSELMRKITSDVTATTNALGPNYRVILKGMDQGVSWVRSGALNLQFYMPYSYEIVPTSLNAYTVNNFPDY